MRRKFILALGGLGIFKSLAAQTQLSISQIKPNQTIVSESLTLVNPGRTLTLSFTPANPFIQLFINGLQTRPVRDFTIAGNVITLIPAYATLGTADTFDVYYYK